MSSSCLGCGERGRLDLIVCQKGECGVAHGFQEWCMSLLDALTPTNGSNAEFGEGEEFIEKGGFSVVAAMVVGGRDQIKTGVEQTIIGARIAAKGIEFFGNGSALCRDDTLK